MRADDNLKRCRNCKVELPPRFPHKWCAACHKQWLKAEKAFKEVDRQEREILTFWSNYEG